MYKSLTYDKHILISVPGGRSKYVGNAEKSLRPQPKLDHLRSRREISQGMLSSSA